MSEFTALLVDDEEDFASTLAERLRLRDVHTIVASDGYEALDIIEAEDPPIVVLDVMMPGIGGIEVLKQIKQAHPTIQVILLTGRGLTKDGIEGMRLGAYDYMMKPVQIEDLLEKMREALKENTREHKS